MLNFLEDEAERQQERESAIQIVDALRAEDINKIKDPLAHAFRLFSEKEGNDLIALAAIQEAALHYPCDWEADPELTKLKLKKNRIPVLTAIGSNDFIPGDNTLVAQITRKACHFQIYGKNHLNMNKAPKFKMMGKAFLNDVNNIS